MDLFFKTSVLVASMRIAGIFLAFCYFVILARLTDAHDYGQFATWFSLSTIIGFVIAGGRHVMLIRYSPVVKMRHGYEAFKKFSATNLLQTLSSAVKLTALSVPIFVMSLFAGYDQLSISFYASIMIMSTAFALSEVTQSYLKAENIVIISILGREIIWRILSIAVAIIVGLLGLHGLSASSCMMISALSLMAVTMFKISIYMDWRSIRLTKYKNEISPVKYFRRKWFAVSSIVSPLSTHSAVICVGLIIDPISAGMYFAADRISKLLALALSSSMQVFGPKAADAFYMKDTATLQRLTNIATISSSAFSLIGALVFILFGRHLLSLFSEEFSSAYDILLILTLGQLVNNCCGPLYTLMDMSGMERQNAILISIIGIIAPIVQIFSGYIYGVIGVAVAAAACQALWGLARVYYCARTLNIYPISFSKWRVRHERN